MAATRNPFSNLSTQSPAQSLVEITPHDTNDLAVEARALIIGTGGTLRVRDREGNQVNMTVVDGQLIPAFITRVENSGTSATGIVALI